MLFYKSLRGPEARARMQKFLREGGQTFNGEMVSGLHLWEQLGTFALGLYKLFQTTKQSRSDLKNRTRI